MRPEKKHIDVFDTIACPIGSAFNVTPMHLNPLVPSVNSSGRIGQKVLHKSLQVRANVLWPGAQTTNAPGQVRIVIVFDKQANGAIATRSDVFSTSTVGISTMLASNSERFITIVDEVTDQCSNGQFTVNWQAYRKLELSGDWATGGATVIPQKGAFLMFAAAMSDTNDATAGHFPDIEVYSRIRYTDV